MNKKFFVITCFIVLILIACTRPARSERHDSTIYYVATTGNDSNPCTEPSAPCLTVRGALAKSDADDKIIVAAGTYNEIPISSVGAALIIEESLWIQGEGPGETIIDLGAAYGGFLVTGTGSVRMEEFTIQNTGGPSLISCIDIRDEMLVTVENVEVTRCHPSGIANSSDALVTLTNVSVSGAIAETTAPAEGLAEAVIIYGTGVVNRGEMLITGATIGENGGAGLENWANLTMTDSVVENNNREGVLLLAGEADLSGVQIINNGLDGSYVAGLDIQSGDTRLSAAVATVSGSVISENPEGIHIFDNSFLILEDSTVSENRETGIFVEDGEAQLTNVDVTANGTLGYVRTGGITNQATLLIRNSRIFQNLNGGIFNEETGYLNVYETNIVENNGGSALLNYGNASIENSLIANNTGPLEESWAAVSNIGNMTILNSTISGNSGIGIGALRGSLFLSYVTVAENGGTGIASHISGAAISRIHNVLVARNGGRGDCLFGSGYPYPTLAGVNMDTDGSCHFPSTYTAGAILLDSLQDNGGPTLTHALLAGSPAIDAATGACPASDQRLATRPFGLACDVGAYEAAGSATSSGTPVPLVLSATFIQNANCRFGPGTAYESDDVLLEGQNVPVEGRSADSSWLWVLRGPNKHCWVSAITVNVSGDLSAAPLIAAPTLPAVIESSEAPPPLPDVTESPEPTVCATTQMDPKACD